MRITLTLTLLLASLGSAGLQAQVSSSLEEFNAGLRHLKLEDASRANRPVWVDLYYPTSTSAEEKPQSFGFVGSYAWEAPFAETAEPLPVVLLSHGAMGSARNYSWLAGFLARRGYVVIGVSHYQESWLYGPDKVDPSAVLRLWERPRDLSFALTALFESPELGGRLSRERVFAVGHSSGGNSAIALAGPRFDPILIASYCQSDDSTNDRGCDYADGDAPARSPAPEASLSYLDPRIRAVVALDPAVGPGYSPESLAVVSVPVLVIGAVDNDFLPFEFHARHYAENIEGAKLVSLDRGEGHFVFLDTCANEMAANGVPLCRDRSGVDRGRVHAQVAELVHQFLDSQ